MFDCVIFQSEVGNNAFELSIFLFQLFHLSNITDFHPAILRLPIVKGGFADPMFPRNVFDRFASFLLVQNGDDFSTINQETWQNVNGTISKKNVNPVTDMTTIDYQAFMCWRITNFIKLLLFCTFFCTFGCTNIKSYAGN
jgi:hypothetical protein